MMAKLEERLARGSPNKLLRAACWLALLGLAIMVYSVLDPRPVPVILAMSVGQGVSMLALSAFFLAVLVDAARRPPPVSQRPQAPSDDDDEDLD